MMALGYGAITGSIQIVTESYQAATVQLWVRTGSVQVQGVTMLAAGPRI